VNNLGLYMEHRGKDHQGQDIWRGQVDAGRGAAGKRKRDSHTVHGPRKEAAAELLRYFSEMSVTSDAPVTDITVGDYLVNHWLEHARTTTAASTYRRYRGIVIKEFVPAFGMIKLADLTPMQIQAFEGRSIARKCKIKPKEDLSAQTVLHFHRVLKRALAQAVRWQLIPRDPCDLVDPPRVQQVEMKALDEKQLLALFAAIQGTRQRTPVVLAATTGMRLGEILALKWTDIDFDSRECQVVRSLQQTDEGLSFKTPKTRRSRRSVLLPHLAIAALKTHRAQQSGEKLLMGPGYEDHELIFARPDGSMWPPVQFSSDFRRLLRLRGFSLRFHDLRHTHASQLLKAGVPVKVGSERLGHATASITLDVYSHVLPGMQAEAVAKIDAALGAAVGE
jgi:integrase